MIGIKDGQLVSEFCANSADTIASLNFKRAIASLFQVATEQREYVSSCSCNLLARLYIFSILRRQARVRHRLHNTRVFFYKILAMNKK